MSAQEALAVALATGLYPGGLEAALMAWADGGETLADAILGPYWTARGWPWGWTAPLCDVATFYGCSSERLIAALDDGSARFAMTPVRVGCPECLTPGVGFDWP